MRVKKYHPVKSVDEAVRRYIDYIAYCRNKMNGWCSLVPVEIFGLDLNGEVGEFSFDDLEKHIRRNNAQKFLARKN